MTRHRVSKRKKRPARGTRQYSRRLIKKKGGASIEYIQLQTDINANNIEGVKKILDASAKVVNETNVRGHTPLMVLMDQNDIYPYDINISILNLLLEKGADVNAKNKDRNTALMLAADSPYNPNNIDVFKILLEQVSLKNINAKDKAINAKNTNGDTALIIASRPRAVFKKDYITNLLEKGADVNAKNKDRNTALHYIIESSSISVIAIVDLFIKKGADVNAKNNKNETVLMTLAMGNGDIAIKNKIIEKLLNVKDIHINDVDNKGYTTLMYAVNQTNSDIYFINKLLAVEKIDVNKADCQGNTALLSTTLHNRAYQNIIEALLNKGADINRTNSYGENLLINRIKDFREMNNIGINSNKNIVSLLLNKKYGANVNAADFKGNTALIYLILYYNDKLKDILYLLLEKGADINAKNEDNKTAFDFAQEKTLNITELLRTQSVSAPIARNVSVIAST